LEVNQKVAAEGEFDAIILAGMGGSGHPGDLLNTLQLPRIPLFVHRSYGLPKIHQKEPLVIISSYSGNTEEALSAYEEAKERGLGIIINTSGGTLEQLSKQESLPLARIAFTDMQPRHTLFASFVGIWKALVNMKLAHDITDDLLRISDVLQKSTPDMEASALELAKKLKGTTPVFASSDRLAFAAKNFKIQTNENAKTPAFWNEFPELNHNEMLGFTQPQAAFHVVMLRDEEDHPRIKARMDVTRELYQDWGVEVSEIAIQGTTLLEKLFYAVTYGLWTTYHLAGEYGIDPVPVEGVENFKARLKEVAG
ncbi:MAG: bifunctional phosphoglucose/phosphomannose isomerase, partial [Acidobacteriota bacterium]